MRVGSEHPRVLVLKALAAATDTPTPLPTDIDDGVPLPQPGQMKIFSFIKPGLVAGDYTVEVSQEVVAQEWDDSQKKVVSKKYSIDVGGKKAKKVTQVFNVTAPQFSIPEADVHSSYPPQGHSDQPNVRIAHQLVLIFLNVVF